MYTQSKIKLTPPEIKERPNYANALDITIVAQIGSKALTCGRYMDMHIERKRRLIESNKCERKHMHLDVS